MVVGQDPCKGDQIIGRSRFIEGKGKRRAARPVEQVIGGISTCPRLLSLLGALIADGEAVKIGFVEKFKPALLHRLSQKHGHGVGTLCDGTQSIRPMPTRIKSRNDSRQRLGRANVRGRLLTTNMLLTGLQCHAKARIAIGIHRGADQSSRHLAGPFCPCRKEAGVGAASEHRHPKSLGGAHDHVCPKPIRRCSRRLHDAKRKQIGDNRDTGVLRLRRQRGIIHRTIVTRILEQDTKSFVDGVVEGIEETDFNVQILTPPSDNIDEVRRNALIDPAHRRLRFRDPSHERNCLGGGRCFV